MTDDIIDQAIESTVPEVVSEPVEAPQEVATEEPTSEGNNEPDEVVFPKKAINALSRRDKQIGKLQAQLAAERAELSRYREQQTKGPVNEPREESFDNYGEYLEAVHRAKWEREQAQKAQEQQQAQTASQQEAWHAERAEYAIDKAKQAIESIPDYKHLFMENADVLHSMPDHIADAFYEADEPALAFYALAKEGKLEALLNMSPSRVAIEIGKAEVRGEALARTRSVTKAPPPIEGLKGAGTSGGKTLQSMNAAELMKWLKS